MSTNASIKAEIAGHVGTNYSAWRIGITADWATRKKEWKDAGHNVDYWHCWQADSSADAKDIESHFIEKELKGGTGGQLSRDTVYVYIF